MGQEGIETRGLPEPFAGKFRAGEAIFHFAMFSAAPDDGAGLVSLPAAAARAIAAKMHGTENAAKAAEGKGGVLPPIVFHLPPAFLWSRVPEGRINPCGSPEPCGAFWNRRKSALSLEPVCLPLHVFNDDVVDFAQRCGIF